MLTMLWNGVPLRFGIACTRLAQCGKLFEPCAKADVLATLPIESSGYQHPRQS